MPTVHGGRFAPTEDRDEWQPGYFERLLDDPGLILAYEPLARTFHIGCTQHPAAQACLAAGAVPADFACPLADAACPLRPLRGSRLLPRGKDNP